MDETQKGIAVVACSHVNRKIFSQTYCHNLRAIVRDHFRGEGEK